MTGLQHRQWSARNNGPPPVETLESVAKTTGHDNVAAGTLTIIGNQISLDFKVFDLLDPSRPKYFYQESSSIASLDVILSDVLNQVITYVNRDQYIATIAPEGNRRIDSGAILRKIKTKAGDLYDPRRPPGRSQGYLQDGFSSMTSRSM